MSQSSSKSPTRKVDVPLPGASPNPKPLAYTKITAPSPAPQRARVDVPLPGGVPLPRLARISTVSRLPWRCAKVT